MTTGPCFLICEKVGASSRTRDVVMFIYKGDRYYTEQQWAKLFPDPDVPEGDSGHHSREAQERAYGYGAAAVHRPSREVRAIAGRRGIAV